MLKNECICFQAHALAERAQLYDSTLETDTSERTAGKPLAGENAVGLIKTNCETVFNNMIGVSCMEFF